MSSGGRVVILSDTHLGRPNSGARSAEALRPLWQGADRLIFNGDTAELALPDLRIEAARQVLAIQQMCEEDGVDATFLPGNHDPMISERRYLLLAGGAIFVTHGDALHPSISPWTAHRHDLRRFHAYTRDSLAPAVNDAREAPEPPLEATLDAAAYASHLTWDDQYWHEHHHANPSRLRKKLEHGLKVARVLWYWQTLPQRAARFARQFAPQAQFFVFGHIHRAGVWRKGKHTLINTGSYDFPVNPRAVVIEDQHLRVHRVTRTDGLYALAPSPVADFAVGRAA